MFFSTTFGRFGEVPAALGLRRLQSTQRMVFGRGWAAVQRGEVGMVRMDGIQRSYIHWI
jgi:hypothetical protein